MLLIKTKISLQPDLLFGGEQNVGKKFWSASMVPPPAEKILTYITPEAVARHSTLVLLTVSKRPETCLPINIPGSPAITVSTQGDVKRTVGEEKAAKNTWHSGRRDSTEKGFDRRLPGTIRSPGATIV